MIMILAYTQEAYCARTLSTSQFVRTDSEEMEEEGRRREREKGIIEPLRCYPKQFCNGKVAQAYPPHDTRRQHGLTSPSPHTLPAIKKAISVLLQMAKPAKGKAVQQVHFPPSLELAADLHAPLPSLASGS